MSDCALRARLVLREGGELARAGGEEVGCGQVGHPVLFEDLLYVEPWVLWDEKADPLPSQGSRAAGLAAGHREADTASFLATQSPLTETRAGRPFAELGGQSPRGHPGVGEGAATAPALEEKPRNRRLNDSNTLNHACSQSLWLVFTWSNELKQGSDELTLVPLLGFRQCSLDTAHRQVVLLSAPSAAILTSSTSKEFILQPVLEPGLTDSTLPSLHLSHL